MGAAAGGGGAALLPGFAHGAEGRPPIWLERKVHLDGLQQWFGLADEALEDAVYKSQAFGRFLGVDLGREAVPEAITVLTFRYLLQERPLKKRSAP